MADRLGAQDQDGIGLGSRGSVNLMTRDLAEAQRFYGAVMGWSFRGGRLGQDFCVAQRPDGTPAAVIGAIASTLQVAVAWTPFFAVYDLDDVVARVRERSGTVAVGPLRLSYGRAALGADRDGAVFGMWQDDGVPGRISGRSPRAWLRLRTRDAFEAAIFYGEVLGWGGDRPGVPEVHYEQEEVVVRTEGQQLARISSGAVEAAPDPMVRPMWRVHFPVDDLDEALRTTTEYGGGLVDVHDSPQGREAMLRDPDGALFTVTELPQH